MKPTPFEIEWMGGAAEHHFRKVRPGSEALPWGTLDLTAFAPVAVAYVRASWTNIAINEYRAVTSFAEITRAFADARAPLDLIAMVGDFLADECAHVEIASRYVMELGGAEERLVDVETFTPRPRGLTAMQRASELALRIGCIDEALSGATLRALLDSEPHPLPRAIAESILRDESRHRRLGGLYFEWALAKIDDEELARLGRVLYGWLDAVQSLWTVPPRVREATLPTEDMCKLGWLDPVRYARVQRDAVVSEVLDPLAEIGIRITDEERQRLLG